MGMETLNSAARAAGFAMAASDEPYEEVKTEVKVETTAWRPSEAVMLTAANLERPHRVGDWLRSHAGGLRAAGTCLAGLSDPPDQVLSRRWHGLAPFAFRRSIRRTGAGACNGVQPLRHVGVVSGHPQMTFLRQLGNEAMGNSLGQRATRPPLERHGPRCRSTRAPARDDGCKVDPPGPREDRQDRSADPACPGCSPSRKLPRMRSEISGCAISRLSMRAARKVTSGAASRGVRRTLQ